MAYVRWSWILVLSVVATGLHAHSAADDKEALEILKRVRRVIGGEGAEVGDWPWLVHLKGRIPTKFFWGIPTQYTTYYCGGSVVNKRWVLTAAHCFKFSGAPSRQLTAKYWHATIGEVNSDHSIWDRIGGWLGEFLRRQQKDKIWYIHAEAIYTHPDYNERDYWKHDVALIKLEEDLPIGSDPDISAVPLPQYSTNTNWPETGSECVMKGWGCVEAGGSVSSNANAVVIPVVDESTCNNYFSAISGTRLCAGTELKSKGICPGDSGGPLVCKVDGKWVQAGIASFTSRDHPGDTPGVFSRVSYYTNWINSYIN